jgi:hypothetical protein
VRALLVLGLLALTSVAGCLSSSPTGHGSAATPDPSSYVVPDVPKVDVKDFLADHAAFVRKDNERAANKPTHEAARQDLMAHFKSYGLETYRLNFTKGIPQADIIGIKWGQVRDKWVVVGGHYDTISDDCLVGSIPVVGLPNPCVGRSVSQGAYDDGSGTMLTVHLAKAFANVSTYYTIAFVAYDGEERGTQGAAAFVDALVTGGEEGNNFTTPYGHIKVVGDIDIDMVGINWPGTMAPINIMTNSESAFTVVNDKRKDMGWPDDQWIRKEGLKLGSSDYARFWEVGKKGSNSEGMDPIPTIFFISDFEEVGPGNYADNVPAAAHTPFGAYPFWHLEDTVETMRGMAGDPPADNLPHPNTEAGFQAFLDLASTELHAMSCMPTMSYDAVPK